jgi:hypothetical protein
MIVMTRVSNQFMIMTAKSRVGMKKRATAMNFGINSACAPLCCTNVKRVVRWMEFYPRLRARVGVDPLNMHRSVLQYESQNRQ